MMIAWQRTVGGRLKSDPSFSNTLVWNTFPCPPLSDAERTEIIVGGQEVLAARVKLGNKALGQRYDPTSIDSNLLEAHDKLDSSLDRAFGFSSRPTYAQRQQRLFERYVKLVEQDQLPTSLLRTKTRRPRSSIR